jgi:hypothetical protein
MSAIRGVTALGSPFGAPWMCTRVQRTPSTCEWPETATHISVGGSALTLVNEAASPIAAPVYVVYAPPAYCAASA